MSIHAEFDPEIAAPVLEDFIALTRLMDKAYDQAAAAFGFVCNGCAESCCETRFYHHTYLEYGLLCRGLLNLTTAQRQAILQAAEETCRQADAADQEQRAYRIMCPLNSDGRCRLYAFRPMICRMHGIAHQFRRPDGILLQGSGCHLFEEGGADSKAPPLDRTPFYRKMAELENKLRQTLGLQAKLKMTIAQMIVAIMENQ